MSCPSRSARVFLLAVALTLALPTIAVAANDIQRYEYRIAWNGIPAASATIEVASNLYGEQEAFVVGTRARTNPFVDLFWRFRGDRWLKTDIFA